MKYELSRIFGPNGLRNVTFDDLGFTQSVFHNASIACPSDNFVWGSITQSSDLNMSDKLFVEEAKIIREAAEKGPCVVVGRCGSYILRERPDVVRVFCTADMEYRKHHAIHDLGMPEKRIEDAISKRDKKRASYYNYYTGKRWSDASSYDLCVSTSTAGIDGAVDTILAFGEMLERQRAQRSK